MVGGNVTTLVPLLRVSDMERSVRYYTHGLGCTMKHSWVVDGDLRWCWLVLGTAALMLQQLVQDGGPAQELGGGVCLYFNCDDAIAVYRSLLGREVAVSEPQVGNGMWEIFLRDPDGYRLSFISPTDVAEGRKLSEVGDDG